MWIKSGHALVSTVSGFRRHMCTWTDNTLTHIHTLYTYSTDQGFFWWEANQKVVLWCWMSSSWTLRETTGFHTTRARTFFSKEHIFAKKSNFVGSVDFTPYEFPLRLCAWCSEMQWRIYNVSPLHEIKTKIPMTQPGLAGKMLYVKNAFSELV